MKSEYQVALKTLKQRLCLSSEVSLRATLTTAALALDLKQEEKNSLLLQLEESFELKAALDAKVEALMLQVGTLETTRQTDHEIILMLSCRINDLLMEIAT